MAYDRKTAERIEKIAKRWKGASSRKMFGGICHLVNGKMFCGVHKEYLILRLGEKGAAEALRNPFARPMDVTGTPMRGWVMIAPQGFADDELLAEWLDEAVRFVRTLPDR